MINKLAHAFCFHGLAVHPDFGRPVYHEELVDDMNMAVKAGAEGYPCRSICIAERKRTQVYSAPDLSILADYLEYEGDSKTFLASVRHYNELCYAGMDSDYGKDSECMLPIDAPPNFGITGYNSGNISPGLVSLSGLVMDNHQNVLSMSGKPIKELFVAGNTLGGRY